MCSNETLLFKLFFFTYIVIIDHLFEIWILTTMLDIFRWVRVLPDAIAVCGVGKYLGLVGWQDDCVWTGTRRSMVVPSFFGRVMVSLDGDSVRHAL